MNLRTTESSAQINYIPNWSHKENNFPKIASQNMILSINTRLRNGNFLRLLVFEILST